MVTMYVYGAWQTAVHHIPLCQDIFFYTLNDDTHQSQPDSCIRTSCKHAKPSSLKYADTTNRNTYKFFQSTLNREEKAMFLLS